MPAPGCSVHYRYIYSRNLISMAFPITGAQGSFWHRALLLLIFPLLLCGRTVAQYEEMYLSYDDFYQGLAPYGQWIQEPQHGYVWVPAVERDFRPYYTNGSWVMSEYGNLWVSSYPWGWACFHYGRWTYDSYYGWLWIPGSKWAPAWVAWRAGEGVYGWAPLSPQYEDGAKLERYTCPGDWWVFIPPQYVYDDHYYQYWNGPHANSKHMKNTHFVTNTFERGRDVYLAGPTATQVKQATGKVLQVYKVKNSKSRNIRLHNDEVRIFKPAEINPVGKTGGDDPYPADVVVAPRPLGQPHGVNDDPATGLPPFQQAMAEKRNDPHIVPGTGINPTAQPEQRAGRTDGNPYEWDVSRSIKQAPQTVREKKTPAPATRTTLPKANAPTEGKQKSQSPGAVRPAGK